MKRRSVILLLFLPFLLAACLDEPDCVTTTSDFVNVRFYKVSTNEIDTLLLSRLTAMGSDSVLNDQDTVTSVRLPLNPQEGRATYYFESQYGMDTLVLIYNLGARLISEDCGVEILYSQIDYLSQSFDSVSVVNQVPSEEITEDIQVYN